MDTREILSKVDHTLLAADCTWGQIKELCQDAIRYETASVASRRLCQARKGVAGGA